MGRSMWLRLEVAALWIVSSFAAGYWIAKRLEPYQPGGPLFHPRSTSGGQP
jgi:hypothetical protein